MITPRDRFRDCVSRLEQRAWSAIDVGWSELHCPGALPGKRIAADQKHLLWCMENLRLIDDLVEGSASGTLSQSELVDRLYDLLHLSMSTAEFIGSRTRMSLSQRNYYASERGRAAGRRSAAKAAEASRPWQEHAEKLALKRREQKPNHSQERLATEILEGWGKPGVSAPAHRSIVDFLSRLEKTGRLPRPAKNGRPTG
jgi:hypothetical protein